MLRFRDTELVGICTNLNNDATERSTALTDYGITNAVLNNYALAIETFANLLRNPREAIAKRKRATLQIAKMLPEIMMLVKNRLDNNMVPLALSNPEFAATYKNLRALNSTSRTTLSLTIITLEKETNKPIAKAELEITGTKISRVSSERGYNKVMHLAAGQHTISASHPDYLPSTVPSTVVKGETTELVVVMERVAGD